MFGSTFVPGGGGGDPVIPDHCVVNCTWGSWVASGVYPIVLPIADVVKDNNSMYSAYRINVKKTGLYEIMGVVIFANSFPDRTNAQALIHINGVLDTYQITYVSHATGAADQPGMARVIYFRNLNVGDYVELIAFQNTGAYVQLGTTLGFPQLSLRQML